MVSLKLQEKQLETYSKLIASKEGIKPISYENAKKLIK
jgi:hypothetical protein